MNKQNLKAWFIDAAIRALKTFAQTFVASIGTGATFLGAVDWLMVLSSSALAAILSFAMSFASMPGAKNKSSDEETKDEEVEPEETDTTTEGE